MNAHALQADVSRALERGLPGFLPGRRWFGAKGRPVADVVAEDVLPLQPEGETGPWLAVARIAYADGGVERYALLVRLDAATSALPAIARLEDRDATLVEVAEEPASVLRLLAAIGSSHAPASRTGARLAGGDLHPGPRGMFAPGALAPGDLRALGAEQSNTSLRLPGYVFKLFRRLDDGENPEVEIGRFLTTRSGFHAMAAVRGSLSLVRPDGGRSTIGVVQDWVENSGDGWSWALGAAALADAGGIAAAESDIAELGATTAAFHEAVASAPGDPAFAPVPFAAADAGAWAAERAERAERVLDALRAHRDALDPADREAADRVLAEAPDAVRRGAPATGGFARIRVHGDYHLGQTLRGRDGWVLVDFEGEPARTLAQRREKQCALKDVAGMLRSFDYVAEAVRRRGAEPEPGAAPRVAAAWRQSFLAGYLGRAHPGAAPFLPGDAAAVRAWCGFFEFDKALYELEYELRSRPDWVGIPLRGILRTIGAGRTGR